ncbi:hypothetical protein DQ04_01011130 [Trypanosoma grayi]|uniref:hypothetical protein n=1 Tax=Trypanosoma grayi TaxID=71804 RepID=UPI0004F41B56|nr:hypothetical protein DQ04_01011130 [Trypanosoma grayi]KEG13430.1 hypothetical protein DQ04_01011130 [Trypanosoma grayi]
MVNTAARMRVAEEELAGWVHVTNQLLLDNMQSTITGVEEPSHRVLIQEEYAAELAALLNAHITFVTSSLIAAAAEAEVASASKVSEEERREMGRRVAKEEAVVELQKLRERKTALEREIVALCEEKQRVKEAIDVAHADADAMRRNAAHEQQLLEAALHQLGQERERRRTEQKEEMDGARRQLLQLREERTVEEERLQRACQRLKLLADVTAQHRVGDIFELRAHEEPEDRIRCLLDGVAAYAEGAQQTQRELQEEVAALQEQIAAHSQADTHNDTPTLYRRIVPAPPANPVATTLLSVRDQAREMRPVTGNTPCGIVHTPILRQHKHQHQQRQCLGGVNAEHTEGTVTPSRSPPSLRWQTPRACMAEGVPSAALAWKERMVMLTAEVAQLRREIGN